MGSLMFWGPELGGISPGQQGRGRILLESRPSLVSSCPGQELRGAPGLYPGVCVFFRNFGFLLGFSWDFWAGWGEVFLGNYLGAFLTLGWFLGEPFGNVPCVGEVLPLLQVLTPLFYTDFPASPFPLTFGIFLHAGTLH